MGLCTGSSAGKDKYAGSGDSALPCPSSDVSRLPRKLQVKLPLEFFRFGFSPGRKVGGGAFRRTDGPRPSVAAGWPEGPAGVVVVVVIGIIVETAGVGDVAARTCACWDADPLSVEFILSLPRGLGTAGVGAVALLMCCWMLMMPSAGDK